MKTSLLPGYTSTWRKAGSKNRSSVAVVQQSFGDQYKWNGRCCSSYHSLSANVLGVKWRFRLRGVFFVVLRSERRCWANIIWWIWSKMHISKFPSFHELAGIKPPGFLLKLPMTSSQQQRHGYDTWTTRIFAPTWTRRSDRKRVKKGGLSMA